MADPSRAAIIRDAAVAARCGFVVEPPIVEVFAPSVVETVEFAEQMLARQSVFEAWQRPGYDLDSDGEGD